MMVKGIIFEFVSNSNKQTKTMESECRTFKGLTSVGATPETLMPILIKHVKLMAFGCRNNQKVDGMMKLCCDGEGIQLRRDEVRSTNAQPRK